MKDFTKKKYYFMLYPSLFICFPWENDARLYENGMPSRAELSVFKKPIWILHSTRHSLDTLEKSEEIFTVGL
jgi:hypothetical protein